DPAAVPVEAARGGRPPWLDPAAYGADVTLREPVRQCRRWLAFHEGAWRGVKGRDWGGLVPGWPVGGPAHLFALLRSADGALQEVARACRAARAGLRQRAEQRRGRPPWE